MSKATEDELNTLHGLIAKSLAEKIKTGDATAADMAVARQFLKDNGIQSLPTKGSPLADLVDELPYADAEEIRRDRELYN